MVEFIHPGLAELAEFKLTSQFPKGEVFFSRVSRRKKHAVLIFLALLQMRLKW